MWFHGWQEGLKPNNLVLSCEIKMLHMANNQPSRIIMIYGQKQLIGSKTVLKKQSKMNKTREKNCQKLS